LKYRVRPKRQSISSWLRRLLSQSNNPGTCSKLEAKSSCLCADAQGTDRFADSHFAKTTPTDALLPRVFVHGGLRRQTEDQKQKKEGKSRRQPKAEAASDYSEATAARIASSGISGLLLIFRRPVERLFARELGVQMFWRIARCEVRGVRWMRRRR